MSKISLKNVCKQYEPNEEFAVKDFSLEIEDNEFIVFVGPSGCGKSTTLRMIAGLEKVSRGEIYINDRLVNDVSPKDRNLAMVFQSYALYPHLTVYDNIGFGLKLRKIDKNLRDKKIKETANMLDLSKYLDRKPSELSGGQKQRVALGRAIVKDTDIFLMDEPLSNLDAKLRSQMREEIVELARNLKATVIYVTHDQTEAMTMATRIVCLKDGLIQQIGSPQELYKNPVNKFVAGFLGSPAMNFIDGYIKDKKFVTADGYILIENINSEDRPICLGIRPEDIFIGEKGLFFDVNLVELLGADINIVGKLYKEKLIIKTASNRLIKAGEKIQINFRKEAVRFFNRENGERVYLEVLDND
ncbi:MAG: sn-glycerol-3-phosphate ABC transporter ATP-binding protein UgpC [Peptoniphilaceae bacterium]|nr:sn-glycerol-3-phosphate ABC transporter ATP-binding protein UgpC [Peptoniphilaceae bacterium]MDY6018189.1 sn-glycerol-3-phosphate ABC transporter ATP-binding protein UgpC [Anaerococcus sp.]